MGEMAEAEIKIVSGLLEAAKGNTEGRARERGRRRITL